MRRSTAIALALALATADLGLWKASFVAGGADAFGYVSEADVIAHGSWQVEQEFVRTHPPHHCRPNVSAVLPDPNHSNSHAQPHLKPSPPGTGEPIVDPHSTNQPCH